MTRNFGRYTARHSSRSRQDGLLRRITLLAESVTRISLLPVLVLISLALPSNAYADELPLRPGDQIQVNVPGMAQLDFQAIIGNEGVLDLNWLGEFDTGGKTLREVEKEVRLESANKIVKQYNRDGILFIVQLDGDEVYLTQGAFQPVIVAGDVATPGAVAYGLNMTVRDAVALAGGPQSAILAGNVIVDPTQLLRLQSDFLANAQANAAAVARQWRIGSELEKKYDKAEPDAGSVNVASEVFAQLLDEQRKVMLVKRDAELAELKFLDEAIGLAEQRIEILERQQVKQAEALATDEEEEERITGLVQRGLAPSGRLSDIRRDTVQSATRLLDLEEQLATSVLELARRKREVAEFGELRTLALLTEQEDTLDTIRTSRLRMDLVQRILGGQSPALNAASAQETVTFLAAVYRDSSGKLARLPAHPDFVLMPGDTLEITLGAPDAVAN